MGKTEREQKWAEYEEKLEAARSKREEKESIISQAITGLNDKIEVSDTVISGLKEEQYRYEIEGNFNNIKDDFERLINQETLTQNEWLQQKVTLMMKTVKEKEITPPRDGETPENDNEYVYFESRQELEAYTAAMEYAYAELKIPNIVDKINLVNGGTAHIMNLPLACKGIYVFSLSPVKLEELREAIHKEMEAGETNFSKRYQEEIGDWVSSDDKFDLENQDSSERKIFGVFTQMLADRNNGVVAEMASADAENSQSMINIDGETLDLAGVSAGDLEDEKLTPKQQGFKVTITLLKGKLEEIKAILAESGEQENQEDFKEQIEMLGNLIDEQHLKEAEEADRIMNDELAQEEESQEQDQSEEFIIEMLLKEKEMKDLTKFCEKNGIDIQVGKEGKAILGEYTRGVLAESQGTSQVLGH